MSNLLAQYDIAGTILRPSDPTVVAMDHLPGWHRLYADHYAVVHARTEEGSPIPWNLASTSAEEIGLRPARL